MTLATRDREKTNSQAKASSTRRTERAEDESCLVPNFCHPGLFEHRGCSRSCGSLSTTRPDGLAAQARRGFSPGLTFALLISASQRDGFYCSIRMGTADAGTPVSRLHGSSLPLASLHPRLLFRSSSDARLIIVARSQRLRATFTLAMTSSTVKG